MKKLIIPTIKLIPLILSLVVLMDYVFGYFYPNIDLYVLDHVFGIDLITILLLFILSYTYKFCAYHQAFIWYLLVNRVLCCIDTIFNLPLSNEQIFALYMSISGFFLFLILYLHQKYVTRKNR